MLDLADVRRKWQNAPAKERLNRWYGYTGRLLTEMERLRMQPPPAPPLKPEIVITTYPQE